MFEQKEASVWQLVVPMGERIDQIHMDISLLGDIETNEQIDEAIGYVWSLIPEDFLHHFAATESAAHTCP